MTTPNLETQRLLLREIHEADTSEIFNCWMQDEEVSRYMWWKASNDIAEARAFVEFELDRIDSEEWFRWLICLKMTNEIIGTCLVFWNDEDEQPHWDISYNLGKVFWGKGYVTEAMRQVIAFAEETLHMTECVTTYAKVNAASANVLHKLGFVDEAEIPYECSGGELATVGIRCRRCFDSLDRM